MINTDPTNVDSLVSKNISLMREVASIKDKIAESRISKVILFVDLCNSTELKQNREDLEWLTDVVLFINILTTNVEKSAMKLWQHFRMFRIQKDSLVTF